MSDTIFPPLPTKCSRADCERKPTWQPELHLWPAGVERTSDNRATLACQLVVCEPHRDELTLDDLISDEGWHRLEHLFSSRGMLAPERASLQLSFTEID